MIIRLIILRERQKGLEVLCIRIILDRRFRRKEADIPGGQSRRGPDDGGNTVTDLQAKPWITGGFESLLQFRGPADRFSRQVGDRGWFRTGRCVRPHDQDLAIAERDAC